MTLLGRLGALSTTQKIIAAAVTVVVLAGGTAAGFALSGSDKAAPAAAPASTTSATPSLSPSPSTAAPAPPAAPPPPPAVNYLTGVGAPSTNPVIAVKIDDTFHGRPQTGIDQADVVYVEEVEAGLTRLIAVFQTNKPTVGPVRSVRASDIELLSQYGRIGLAASGGGGDSLPTLDKSVLKGYIMDRGGSAYYRDYSRWEYINVMLRLNQLGSLGAAPAKSIGWTWAPSLAGAAGVAPGTSLQTVVGGTPVAFRWNPQLKRYVRYIDGVAQKAADGKPVATPNVVVMFCQGHVNPNDIDVVGNPGHYTTSIGTGQAVIFRDGQRVKVTWSRPSLTSGTTFTDAAGHPVPLAPGGAWVVMPEAGKATLTAS